MHAQALRDVGTAHFLLNDYQSAVEKFNLSLNIRKTLSNLDNYQENLIILFKDLKFSYSILGNHERCLYFAELHLKTTLLNFANANSPEELTEKTAILDQLGDVYKLQNEYEKSWKIFTDALNIRLNLNTDIETSLFNLETLSSASDNRPLSKLASVRGFEGD